MSDNVKSGDHVTYEDADRLVAAAVGAETRLPISGRAEYESDLKARPTYHDGSPRKTWEQLGDVERWSWGRPSYVVADPSPTYWEGWDAKAAGWPLAAGHSEQYRAGWIARASLSKAGE